MKAMRLLEYGGQLVLNDVPTPTIARDEILAKRQPVLALARRAPTSAFLAESTPQPRQSELDSRDTNEGGWGQIDDCGRMTSNPEVIPR